MRFSRRNQLRWLMALPFSDIASLASVADPGAFAGTWSGMAVDANRKGSGVKKGVRVRLVISAQGEVIIWAIDTNLIHAQGTKVQWKASTIDFEVPALGMSVHGRLVERDRIEATAVSGDRRDIVSLTRGDFYSIKRTVLPAGPITTERLHSLRLISEAPGMGVGWAFKHGSRTVMVDGIRGLNTVSPVKVQQTDAWHIGSVTKSMTATLVARLVEAGRLRWTDTVGELFTQHFPTLRHEYKGATLIDLLSHHSGLPREAPHEDLHFTFGFAHDIRMQRIAYSQRALEQPPVVRPRTTMSYSNIGYIVVGAILEQSLSMPWEKLIQEYVFQPLGLHSAGFGPPVSAGISGAPVGHARASDGQLHAWTEPEEADLPAVEGPAGLVHATLDDLLTWLEAHRDQPTYFLARSTWRKLHTSPFHDGYALGWGVEDDGSLSHNGSNGMWMASVFLDKPTGAVFAGALNADTPEASSVLDQTREAALLSKSRSQR